MEQQNKPKSETEIEEDLQIIKHWLLKQPHLPKDFDDHFLISYIKQCKSLEKVKTKIDAFCTARTNMPQYFQFPSTDILDPAFRQACKFTHMFFLPKATPENYRVFFTKGCNIEDLNCHQAVVRMIMMMELSLMKWPDTNGIVFIMDVAGGADSSFISKFDIVTTYKGFHYLEKSSPLKLKNIIMFNSTSTNDFIFNNIVKPFLNTKMTSRMISSTDDKILKNYVPLSILPKEYEGGTAPSSQELNDEWLEILEKERDWFAKYSMFCSDENKRPPEAKKSECMMNGTFKYLSID